MEVTKVGEGVRILQDALRVADRLLVAILSEGVEGN
jgi:hypothetical protein